MRRNFVWVAVAVLMTGCAADPAETEDDSTAALASPLPRQRHQFRVATKGFIAPIRSETLGDLGSASSNAALFAFASATNIQFSEDPRDGAGPSRSGQYRLWAEITLDVSCVGNKVSSFVLRDPQSDSGYEGPLKAETDPIIARTLPNNRFYFQARGRPHPSAEPAFRAVHSRERNTIWYALSGDVECDADADATLHFDQITTTKFPSFRMWVRQDRGFLPARPEALVLERAQGNFSELWSLPAPPAPPAGQ